MLDELKKQNELLLPKTVKVIKNRIKEQFDAKYADEPSPITLSYTDNPEEYSQGKELPVVYFNQAAKNFNFLEQAWNNLTKILLFSVDWQIIHNCCIKVLSQYSNDPHSISSQLCSINSQLLEEREQQRLNKIQVRGYELIKEILLEKNYQENNQFQIPLILVFVQNLLQEEIPQKTEEELILWRDTIAQGLKLKTEDILHQARVIFKNKYKDIYAKLNPFLLISFQSLSSSEFNLEAELIFQENDFADNESKPIDISQRQYNNIASENICEKCCELIAGSNRSLIKYKNTNKLTIEFFYPRKYLLELHLANQSIEGEDSPWFGSKYKTTTRYYERCQDYTHRKDLIVNWQYFEELVKHLSKNTSKTTQDKNKSIADKMLCLNLNDENVRWKKLRRDLSNDKKIGLNLDLPLLHPDNKKYIEEFLNTILRCGLPFSFWLREKSLEKLKLSESQEAIDEFKDFLEFEYFKQPEILLEYIREIRENSYIEEDEVIQQKYLGYNLGFLCDNPHRLPSWFDEEKGQDVYTFENR